MKIVVASGKGGTGKTTLAVSLALALAENGHAVTYADCDVEEPNGHIFLKPTVTRSETAGVSIPVVDSKRCTACGECGQMCRFSAIVCLGAPPLTYPELCKSCGGCLLVCEEGALSEGVREIGLVEEGWCGDLLSSPHSPVRYVGGRLRIGEAQSPPLIKRVKACIPDEGVAVLDAPPGTSCPVIETVQDADFVLLVTEPTPFGLNDLMLAVEMVRLLEIPFAVGINRAGVGNDDVAEYCHKEEIPVLFELKDDRRVAEAYSRGEPIWRNLPEYRDLFFRLGHGILEDLT